MLEIILAIIYYNDYWQLLSKRGTNQYYDKGDTGTEALHHNDWSYHSTSVDSNDIYKK